MLSEYWQEILQDQILGDEEKKERYIKAMGFHRNVCSMEGCKIAEGEVLECVCRTTVAAAFKEKTNRKFRLRLVRKYPHFALFENLDGKAPNNYICFDYLETDQIRRGKYAPELY